MNKNKFNIKILKEYLATIAISFFIVIFISCCIEFELMCRTQKLINLEDFSSESLNKFHTIEQLEKELKENPDNPLLNIKLARMYESINKLEKANDYYKAAIKLSNSSNYAIYSYAIFCAKHNLYATSACLAEDLTGNGKNTNLYKAKIYEQLAESFDKENQISASVKSYQIAYKYVKSLKKHKYLNAIAAKYSNEYIKLADLNINRGNTLDAISNLKNSLKIKKNATANYKLGLIYLPADKLLAEKYFKKAFYINPYVVNPLIYNKLLNDLIVESKQKNQNSLINFYTLRLERFKTRLSETYLFKNQINISNFKVVNCKKTFTKNLKYITFNISNKTKFPIDSLIVKIEFFNSNSKVFVKKRVITKTNPLDSFETKSNVKIQLPVGLFKHKKDINDDLYIKCYAKRTQQAPWTLIKINFINI